MRTLMEMKHLGSTLEQLFTLTVPRCRGWLRVALLVNYACVCLCLLVSTNVWWYSVYMTGWDPGGSAIWRWPLRRRGRRGHLLAGGSKMRVTGIHLSESMLIPDPICPTPLGYLLPKGPHDPHCRLLDQASCPSLLRPAETASTHLRAEAILGHCNTVNYPVVYVANTGTFTRFFLFLFQSDLSPQAFCVRLCYKSPGLAKSSQVADREVLYLLPFYSFSTFSELIMVSCSTDNRSPTTKQFGNSNNGHI